MIRQSAIIGLVFAATAMVSARADGGTIWQWTHDASGSGSANVFDGGPVLTSEGATTGPDDSFMTFLAADRTQLGSSGASAAASGRSRVVPQANGGILFDLRFDASYGPGLFPGGDNTGGTAAGELHSEIEFVMPADELFWAYQLQIDQTIDFAGSARVVFENLSRGEVLLDLSSRVSPSIKTTLAASTGDVMRLTIDMSGSGETGPAPFRRYSTRFGSVFRVPEPTMLFPLLLAVLFSRRALFK